MNHYRSIFLSDIHIGSKAFQADKLMLFLNRNHCDYLFLVGDIIDVWRMEVRGINLPQLHVNILNTLIGKAQNGTKIYYIPGNHDRLVLDIITNIVDEFTFVDEFVYETANKKKLLIIHGDHFHINIAALYNPEIRLIIDRLYYGIIWLSWLTRPLFKCQSLSERIIGSFRQVKQYFLGFEHVASNLARERGYDGIICGHIHFPKVQFKNGFIYINCGDWIDNCTAIVEDFDGNLKLVKV